MRHTLLRVFAAALRAVEGRAVVRRALAERPLAGPIWVCAVGKAAQSMAMGALDALGADCVGGLLITKPGHLDPPQLSGRGVECRIGGHPIPDARSLEAGGRLVSGLSGLAADTGVLVLLSGGASSLVEVPAPGLGLSDLQRANEWLLGRALPIDAVNRVRKALSLIKGGGLLKVLRDRRSRVLAISDVPSNAPGVIGSGLLVPEVGLAEGLADLALPPWLAALVRRGLEVRAPPPAQGPEIEVVATLGDAMAAAAAAGHHAGLRVHLHRGIVEGEAVLVGRRLAGVLLAGPPGLHVWGGETTVRLPDAPGRGGRNQHLALAAAVALAGDPNVWLLSAGSDGSDGPGDDAGGLIDGGTLGRAIQAGLDAETSLARADSGSFLAASGDLVRTGPTGTNVMDLMLGLRA